MLELKRALASFSHSLSVSSSSFFHVSNARERSHTISIHLKFYENASFLVFSPFSHSIDAAFTKRDCV